MTTTRESLLREAQTATEDYRAAWRDLDDQLALQRLGMSNHVMLATYRERAAYDRWMAASERSVAQSSAPTKKATVAPKPATAPVTPKPTAQPQASSAFLDYLVDQCGGQLSPLDPRFRRGR